MTGCPACSGPGRSTGIRRTTTRLFEVERCAACGLAFASPRPSEAELDEFYSTKYFRRPEDAEVGYTDYAGESWAQANAQRMWSVLTKWEPSIHALRPRTLLDVGCAFGDFALSAAADGWTARGVELADDARAEASAAGVEVTKTLDEASDGNGLITMFHVLEHVLEPAETLRQAREKAAVSGRLVVELPQWRSLGRVLRRGGWSALTPPEHINFFDVRSMRFTLSATGWSPVRIATIHPQAADRAIEAIQQRQLVRAARYAAESFALERTGVAGYLRIVAAPA